MQGKRGHPGLFAAENVIVLSAATDIIYKYSILFTISIPGNGKSLSPMCRSVFKRKTTDRSDEQRSAPVRREVNHGRVALGTLSVFIALFLSINSCGKAPSSEELQTKADWLAGQGEFLQAASVTREILTTTEMAYGPQDTLVAQVLTNLVTIYWQSGNYDGTEPWCRRALTIWENRLPPVIPI